MISMNLLCKDERMAEKSERECKKCEDEQFMGMNGESSMYAIDKDKRMRHFDITFHKNGNSSAQTFNPGIMADLLLLIALWNLTKEKTEQNGNGSFFVCDANESIS